MDLRPTDGDEKLPVEPPYDPSRAATARERSPKFSAIFQRSGNGEPSLDGTQRHSWAGMTTHGSLGNKRASIIDRLFYAVGGILIVIGNGTPDVEKYPLWREA